MKEINIKYVIKNSEGETMSFKTKGTYDKENQEICYFEKDLKVNVFIEKDSIRMIRKGKDYMIDFLFQLDSITKNKYELKSLGIYVDLEIETRKLIIEDNSIIIKYTLINEEEHVGDFEYDLCWE